MMEAGTVSEALDMTQGNVLQQSPSQMFTSSLHYLQFS